MFKFNELKNIHLEITNNCQASCPMCTRNIHGGVENPLIELTNWTVADYKTIITTEVINQIHMLYFCGNYGDPLLNNDLIEMIKYTVSVKPEVTIRIHTNGSLRSTQWWHKLALSLPKDHLVVFAIDGLEDTHSIYRIGTNYDKIIENSKAFIDAGGKAEWAFIRFKHNEHQVDQVKQIAQKLGFVNFTLKDSSRFLIDTKFPVYDKNKNIVNYLEPSNQSILKFIDKKVIDNYKNVIEQTTIDCMALRQKEIYITAQRNVFPCCWLAQIPYQMPDENVELHSVRNMIRNQYEELVDSLGGINALSAMKNSIKSIIDSESYQTVWGAYWTTNKLITCGRNCNITPDLFSTPNDQFISKETL